MWSKPELLPIRRHASATSFAPAVLRGKTKMISRQSKLNSTDSQASPPCLSGTHSFWIIVIGGKNVNPKRLLKVPRKRHTSDDARSYIVWNFFGRDLIL